MCSLLLSFIDPSLFFCYSTLMGYYYVFIDPFFCCYSIATRQLFCVEEWAKLESEKERGFFLGSRGHFRLPRCEDLPRMGSRSGTYFSSSSFGSKQLKDPYGLDPPTCSRAQLTQLIPAQVTSNNNISSFCFLLLYYKF